MSGATAPKSWRVSVAPHGDRLQAEQGEKLFRLLTRHGYAIPSACGGQGSCGKCMVLIHEGRRPPTEPERVHLSASELSQGWRLACQQRVDREIALELPQIDETARAKERLKHQLRISLDAGIEKRYLKLPEPGRADQRPDTVRLGDALGQERLDASLRALRRLPRALREKGFRITVTHEGSDVLDVELGDTSQSLYGVAIDIGTTSLAGYLLDLRTGEELAIRSRMNPQTRFGADVISRIKHVHEEGEEGLQELQEAVVSGINAIVKDVCRAADVEPEHIYKATVVGNPTMVHLFTAVPPSYIDHSPYTPVLSAGLKLSAKELSLALNPAGRVYVLPAVSGYVGADIAAGVLFSELHRGDELSLYVDIGTNAEIILGDRERLLACSTPAGPAFEGARIHQGMGAQRGAIAHVRMDGGELELEVIGNGAPRGICGSGLIDLVAELIWAGLIDETGTLRARNSSPYTERITQGEGDQPRFMVAEGERPVYLTQGDIRELQLAKGAIRAGVELVLDEWGAAPQDLAAVYLAGAFGSYVRAESVLQIGMLPPLPPEMINPLGNAAGQGAKLALLNRGKWAEVQELAGRIRYLELSYRGDFSERFMTSMRFPRRPG